MSAVKEDSCCWGEISEVVCARLFLVQCRSARERTLLATPRCRHETEVCIEARPEQMDHVGSRAPFLPPLPPGHSEDCVEKEQSGKTVREGHEPCSVASRLGKGKERYTDLCF